MGIIFVIVCAYLFGSIPVGLLVARTYNIDIRQVGSGNIGATNVLRVAGWGPALVVFFADTFKGGLAILVAQAFNFPVWEISFIGLAAVLGHSYSIFLGFRGGKGVATSFGTVLLIDPGLALAMLCVAVVTVLVTRFVSAASIISGVSGLILAIAMRRWETDLQYFILYVGLLVLVVFKHRDNLRRMYEGTENRIDQRKS